MFFFRFSAQYFISGLSLFLSATSRSSCSGGVRLLQASVRPLWRSEGGGTWWRSPPTWPSGSLSSSACPWSADGMFQLHFYLSVLQFLILKSVIGGSYLFRLGELTTARTNNEFQFTIKKCYKCVSSYWQDSFTFITLRSATWHWEGSKLECETLHPSHFNPLQV